MKTLVSTILVIGWWLCADKWCFGCDEVEPVPLQPRIDNRNFPSVLAAWPHAENYARYDLVFDQFAFKSGLVETDTGYEIQTGYDSWDGPASVRDGHLAKNPTLVFLHELYVLWRPLDWLPEDSPYWLRDENGVIQRAFGHGLMDVNNPDWQREVIAMAVAFDQCGLWDGIMIDGWGEQGAERNGHLEGMLAILKGIREQVSDNFLILVNTNDKDAPRSAPYINGLFMETVFPSYRPESEMEFYLTRIENTLSWAATSLREPNITGLQGFPYRDEPADSERNKRWMRAFTTMSLTFHDGYVAFTLREGPGYDFWDADLGQPVGETLQLYDSREGLYIREFTKGWAVYNHSGAAQVITLPEEVESAATGISHTEHALLNLDGDIFLKTEVSVPGDLNGDGAVSILDLVIVAQAMGTDKHEADVNRDGVINIIDLVFVANQF